MSISSTFEIKCTADQKCDFEIPCMSIGMKTKVENKQQRVKSDISSMRYVIEILFEMELNEVLSHLVMWH